MTSSARQAIVFDLGGVLVNWDPEYLYRKIFSDEKEMRYFLNEVCTPDWNEQQDEGRSVREGTELLVGRYPHYEKAIRAYYGRWEEMLGEPFEDTIAILSTLKEQGDHPLYALTNWSAETFPIAYDRYDFLHWFDGIVVSGAEKTRKPFPLFYQLLLDRYHLIPEKTFFTDDNLRNITAAQQAGLDAELFTTPAALRSALERRKLI
ncbi:HAD family phosphatase [Compostibacter hankyongensis]|uniref:HAD-IA family hydrolase n=1 Tax=Compostibacter hankyongensis TaxID=1007089 RepID=A0ABP8FHA2_9BACT